MRVQRPSRAISPRMTTRAPVSAYRQHGWVILELTVHQYCFGDVISVVSSYDVVHVQASGTTVKSLSSKDATESAVVFPPNFLNDSVHSPSVKLIV